MFVSRFACLGDMCDCLFINLIVYLFVQIVCACPESILLGCFVFYLFVRIVPACPGLLVCLFKLFVLVQGGNIGILNLDLLGGETNWTQPPPPAKSPVKAEI